MRYFAEIVSAVVAEAADVEAVSTPARFGQFAEAEKALRENFAELANAAISAHPEWNDIYEEIPMDVELYISAAMSKIEAVVRDLRPELFDYEECGRKTVVQTGSSEFSGARYYLHDSGKLAVEAASWITSYVDVEFDDYGRPYDCPHAMTECKAGIWVRYTRNPNTGQSFWLMADSRDCIINPEWVGSDAVSLVKTLAAGILPERLPEGWHEVPELDFGCDGKTTPAELSWCDVPMPRRSVA